MPSVKRKTSGNAGDSCKKNSFINTKAGGALLKLLSAFFWILVWYIGISIANKGLIMKIPGPYETVVSLLSCCTKKTFWKVVWVSVGHILYGYLLAVVLGSIAGIISGLSKGFSIFTAPIMHLVRSVPVAALIVVLWLWIPSGKLSSVVAFLLVAPVIYSHARQGVNSIDEKLVEAGKVYGFSNAEITLKIRIPQILPSIRTGCLTGMGMAWKSGVAAEVIASPTGTLGSELAHAKSALEYAEVFAITLMIILLSALFEILLKLLWSEKRRTKNSLWVKKKYKPYGQEQGCGSIDFDNVSFAYGDKKVLEGMDLHINPGERIAFTGHSGCGKSTTLKLIEGIIGESGQLNYQKKCSDEHLTEDGSHFAKTDTITVCGSISAVFQEDRLMPYLTVCENVDFTRRTEDERKTKHGGISTLSAIPNATGYILNSLGMSECMELYPDELSGGMARRVAIARALASEADIYIFDEPFTGLDAKNIEKCAALINEITEGKTVIVVSHDEEDIDRLGVQRLYKFDDKC